MNHNKNGVSCPKCKCHMTKQSQPSKATLQQQNKYPQYSWATYLCKCGYESVRIAGSK